MPRITKSAQLAALSNTVQALLDEIQARNQAIADLMTIHGYTCGCDACVNGRRLIETPPALQLADAASAASPLTPIAAPMQAKIELAPGPLTPRPTPAGLLAQLASEIGATDDDLAQLDALAALQAGASDPGASSDE